jgi:uncharacterized protein
MPDWMRSGLEVLVITGMLVGLLGLLVPFFPGLTVIWLALLAFGLVEGFNWISGILFGVATVLMLIGGAIDNILMNASAREKWTSWLALGISFLVLVVGSLLITPLGGLLLSMLAIFIVELVRKRDWRKAFSSLGGMAIGWGGSTLVRFAIGLMMIGLWVIWWMAFS